MRVLTIAALTAALTAPMTLGGCSKGLDEDVPFSEQADDGDREDAISGVMEGSGGVLAESEASCWIDSIFDSGATPGDVMAFSDDPLAAASGDMVGLLIDCLDPTLEVSAPLEGATRDALVEGFVTGGVTPAVAECVMAGLDAAGFDARDIALAGWSGDQSAPVMVAIPELVGTCQASGG